MQTAEKITIETLKEYGVELRSEFVPWSKSRNFKDNARLDERSLNYKITVYVDGREILRSDYMCGLAHAPSWGQWDPAKHGCKYSLCHAAYVEYETEHGKTTNIDPISLLSRKPYKPIPVNLVSAFWCILMDAQAVNYSSFEDWADEYGYDTDSRKAEKMYRDCLETGLKLRNALRETRWNDLLTLFEDY